jgi:hypothetical protein
MIFVDALPKNENGQIPFNPAGQNNDTGEYASGTVNPEWMKTVFPDIANDELPLAREHYDAMKAIDKFWTMNAAQWRKNGVVEVEGLAADELLDDEEELLATLNPVDPEQPTEEPETEPTPEADLDPEPTQGEEEEV